jgi:hypothetical protein
MTRAPRRAPHAMQRRLRKYRERLESEPRRAQPFLPALEQALGDLGRPETLVAAVEWRLQAQVTLLGNSFGRRCPTGCGCRTVSELTQGRGLRQARLTATRATYGRVTLVLVDQPGDERGDVRCRATPISAPRLSRAWSRRSWMAPTFRTLTHLWAAEACQVQTEDAYDGHLVWRLLAGLVRLSTARFRLQGRVTREAIVFRLKPHGRFLTSAPLE